jgi:UDP-glucose 4-epimerase
MDHVITGGAGFIAVNLARSLLARGDRLVLLDDLSRGHPAYVEALRPLGPVAFHKVDVADENALGAAMAGVSPEAHVWHLCANSDIPAGVEDPAVDLHDTFMTTYALLRVMRKRGMRRLHFASTSAVYGDHGVHALHEEAKTEPISNYGAMKLASEALIRAAAEAHLDIATVFRFPNVIGTPATHGVLIDFIRKLAATPGDLAVLGNGTQKKSYLHVAELVEAMLFITAHGAGGYRVFNIGPADTGITVREIAEAVRYHVSPGARLHFGTADRGWVGDVPRFVYAIDKLRALGWSPRLSSHEAITRAIAEIAAAERTAHGANPGGTSP